MNCLIEFKNKKPCKYFLLHGNEENMDCCWQKDSACSQAKTLTEMALQFYYQVT